MRRINSQPLILGIFITLMCAASWTLASGVSYPSWWQDSGLVSAQPPPGPGQTGYNITTYNAWVAQNYQPANVGQLKNFAAQTKTYLDNQLAGLGGAGPAIGNIVANFTVTSPNNYSPVTLGQVKALAQPIYDRLYAISFNVSVELETNYGLTGLSGNWNGTFHYPWPNDQPPAPGHSGYNETTYNTWVAQNYQPANLGQIKAIFSFDLSASTLTDTEGDGLPDWWQMAFFGNLSHRAGDDPRGDGNTVLYDYHHNLVPVSNITVNITSPTEGGQL